MTKKIICFLLSCILVISGLFIVGCEEQHEPVDESEDNSSMIEEDTNGLNNIDKNENKTRYDITDSKIAEHLSYHKENKSLYVAGMKEFEEFGTSNEGTISIDTEENILTFSLTKATGSVTGTLDGPTVFFKMDLDAGKIIDKNFSPAPDYDELGKEEFSEYSEKVIELTEERMLEIGSYFEELITEIETEIEED